MKRYVTFVLSWVGYVILISLIVIFLLPRGSETQGWFFLISLILPQMVISMYLIIWQIYALDKYKDVLSVKIASVMQILIIYLVTITSFGFVYIGRLKDGGEITSSIYTAYYFSIITITTTGYGDVVPMHGIARIAAALEALLGFSF